MKKLIAIIAILALATSAFATESDPSETVGFYKVDTPVGYTVFSHPFTYYDATHAATLDLDDIIGDQLTGGNPATSDRIWDANTGAWAFYNTGVTPPVWAGTLTDFTLINAYYAKIASIPNDVYLAGSVEQDVLNFGTMAVGYNVIGFKEAGSVSLDDLDLIACGFTGGNPATSDRIWDANTGAWAFYNTGATPPAWAGTLTQTTIGHAYYILVKNTAFDWTYDPIAKGTATAGKVEINKVTKPINFR